MEDGSFPKRTSDEQKTELFGLRGQYTGKGEVLRVMIPDCEENGEYLPKFRQIIANYVNQLEWNYDLNVEIEILKGVYVYLCRTADQGGKFKGGGTQIWVDDAT